MITVTVQFTSMSRRYYVLSFDGVQCCVEWNYWPLIISFIEKSHTADVMSSGVIHSASRSCQVTAAAVCLELLVGR